VASVRQRLSLIDDNTHDSPTIVLVHGGFVDGSGWEDVYRILKKDGYGVSVVQDPTTFLADDVAVTERAIAGQNGPTPSVAAASARDCNTIV